MADDLFSLFQREIATLQKSHDEALKQMTQLHAHNLHALGEQHTDKLATVAETAAQVRGEVAKFEGQINRAHDLTRQLDARMWLNAVPSAIWLLYAAMLVGLGAVTGMWLIADRKVEEGRAIGFKEGQQQGVIWAFENPKDFAKAKAEWQERQAKGQGSR